MMMMKMPAMGTMNTHDEDDPELAAAIALSLAETCRQDTEAKHNTAPGGKRKVSVALENDKHETISQSP